MEWTFKERPAQVTFLNICDELLRKLDSSAEVRL